MGWKVIDGPRAVKLTRHLAEKFSQMERFPHDRDVQQARLEHLKRVIAEGRFRSPEWSTAKCLETGKTYRVNGKHTSTILATADTLPDVKVIVTDYECNTLEDVANLYATFDARFSARSAKDVYMVYATSCDELRDVSSKHITNAAAGIAYAMWEERSNSHAPEEKAQNLIRHSRFVASTVELLGSRIEHKFLWRGPVCAAMFLTDSKDREDSVVFWSAVREGTDTDPKSATRVLQRYLMTVALSGKDKRTDAKVTTNHEMFVKCLRSWNAWRSGEVTALRYNPDQPTPELV